MIPEPVNEGWPLRASVHDARSPILESGGVI